MKVSLNLTLRNNHLRCLLKVFLGPARHSASQESQRPCLALGDLRRVQDSDHCFSTVPTAVCTAVRCFSLCPTSRR